MLSRYVKKIYPCKCVFLTWKDDGDWSGGGNKGWWSSEGWGVLFLQPKANVSQVFKEENDDEEDNEDEDNDKGHKEDEEDKEVEER